MFVVTFSNTKQTLHAFALGSLLVALPGCTTAPRQSSNQEQPTPVTVEVEHTIGFTIKEPGKVTTDARLDYDEAQQLLSVGEFARAIAILKALADEVPHLSAPQIDLGIAYHRAGDLENAELNLLKALETNPAHPIALNELGIVLRKTGRFAQARQSYQAALAVYPNFHYARRNLGILCDLYLSDYSCALENYQAYAASLPGDREASIWIADLRKRMGQTE